MPLTVPTHPMAVLPLKLWRPRSFDGVALVVGATAPDLSYAMYGWGIVLRTHNLRAVVWWGLPVTLLLTWLIRRAAPVVAAHLPGLGDYGVLGSVRHRWYITVGSALLGAYSHVVWDSVTHPGQYARLDGEIWPGMTWWGLLSDASNVLGLAGAAVLIRYVARTGLLRRWHGPAPRIAARPAVFWPVVAAVATTGGVLLIVRPVDWFAGQAIRGLLIAVLALFLGAAASHARLLAAHHRDLDALRP